MATLTIIGILAFLNSVQHGAIIAALGVSSFIVFTMPNSYPSYSRPLIGGYIIGVASGVACSLLGWTSATCRPTAKAMPEHRKWGL